MNYIQYSVYKKETGNAGGKAKNDAFDIALRMGFSPSYHPAPIRLIRVAQQLLSMHSFRGKKVVFFQYPAVKEELIRLFGKVVSNDSIKVALIHDLLSLQYVDSLQKLKEGRLLNIFNYLIVHNAKMGAYVKEIGYTGKIICLDLFDYLHDINRPITNPSFSNSVSFAGNLTKSDFLTKLNKIDKCHFLLYGNKGDKDFSDLSNVEYKGMLPSDEIPYLMEGDYGLVWDGDSISSCSGLLGEYLRYNNPHKLSLCVAAGKPVITWKEAAIADFVEKNKIGITVNSLEELNGMDLTKDYKIMKSNVLKIKKDIGQGKYLERAIEKALSNLDCR